MREKSTCSHRRVRGPKFLGEPGAICDDCEAELPCPHPPDARKTLSFIGEDNVRQCGWCGIDM